MEQDKVNRVSDATKKVWDEDGRKKTAEKAKVTLGQRWANARPTKTVVFWSCLASIILTMIVGFNWGGWVTGGTAEKMALTMSKAAVVERLAPVCVAQFNQDLGKDQKLLELKEASSYQRNKYVQDQGWATIPGEAKPDSQVAAECVKLLMLSE